MSPELILVLPAARHAALATVRDQPGLHCALAPDGRLWLRGLPPEPPLPVQQLPAEARYHLDAAGRLFPVGRATPTGQLPAGLAWQPVRTFAPLGLPVAALPSLVPAPAPAALVPLPEARPGAAILTTLAALQQYAETAPAIRLERLRFAVAGPRRVLVLGTPLPPVPGLELWQHGQLLLPAGLGFESELVAALVVQQLSPGTDFVLFGPDGGWERVAETNLVPATRSAVRLTVAAVHG
ncbi:hypothetical protein [Hymenobacter metallilatus]|uniref:MoxR-vWA-beta-propeller ternary system domain-containing protein n=1 Tax=Hymenobacter metallilatus TaxID=2493666 RepID=A0A428JRN4_9BACT|nr:hypothetical protein [Hymenobacter metallilatus]RSK36272.1 hypothetical protein EI290_05150 [Hymenobacter metallilatus]